MILAFARRKNIKYKCKYKVLCNFILLFALCSLGFESDLLAQAAEENATEPTDGEKNTLLDPSPFISARAAGMGGAISTLADGIHAPFYNPAGIGGLHWGRTEAPTIRQFHFPYFAGSANKNAEALSNEFSKQGGTGDRSVGEAIVDANTGKRQYARASGLLSMVISRFTFVQYSDTQFAAIRTSEPSLETNNPISAAYRSQSGFGMGASICDSEETVYIGAFSSYNQRSQFQGDFNYNQLVRQGERKVTLLPQVHKYTGLASNIGMLWVLQDYGRPTLALVNKNIGGTVYRLKESNDQIDESLQKLVDEDDLTIGFSFSPSVGKSGAFNFIVEGDRLTDKQVSLDKKFRTALELNLGGFGSEATFGIRAGYNLAGASAGLNFNLGLIQIELASQAEDVGLKNRHIKERRNVAVFSVNVLYE